MSTATETAGSRTETLTLHLETSITLLTVNDVALLRQLGRAQEALGECERVLADVDDTFVDVELELREVVPNAPVDTPLERLAELAVDRAYMDGSNDAHAAGGRRFFRGLVAGVLISNVFYALGFSAVYLLT